MAPGPSTNKDSARFYKDVQFRTIDQHSQVCPSTISNVALTICTSLSSVLTLCWVTFDILKLSVKLPKENYWSEKCCSTKLLQNGASRINVSQSQESNFETARRERQDPKNFFRTNEILICVICTWKWCKSNFLSQFGCISKVSFTLLHYSIQCSIFHCEVQKISVVISRWYILWFSINYWFSFKYREFDTKLILDTIARDRQLLNEFFNE